MSNQLQNAIDTLGWTNQSDDDSWKYAAWQVMRAMHNEIGRLSREVEKLAATPEAGDGSE
ncbi:MAG: hypothetical protein KGZ65_06140 [Sphingomonadales bacterium]|nr:hypothetical protein [Sphingomonadaceae bacterium]MBS3930799.1 hypothetical protein [Sphingomonadales bacterium]